MENIDKAIESSFACPHCGEKMYISDNRKSVFCTGGRKHCFDFSSDGYLAMGQGGGDSKEAVRARKSFLSKDYYLKGASDICSVAKKYLKPDSLVIDAGCGEGYYTNKISSISGITVGFDLSKFACAAASKSARSQSIKNSLFVTGSVFELPLGDKVADMVVNIFAPCAEDEYSRVLKDDGYLIVVGAGENHLMGLKEAIYENTYVNTARADMPKNMTLVEKTISSFEIEVVGSDDIASLFLMTPYYWRTKESDKEKLSRLDSLKTVIEFEISVYKKN